MDKDPLGYMGYVCYKDYVGYDKWSITGMAEQSWLDN